MLVYANTTPFYVRELEHPWILVSGGIPGTNPPWIQRDNCNIFKMEKPDLFLRLLSSVYESLWERGGGGVFVFHNSFEMQFMCRTTHPLKGHSSVAFSRFTELCINHHSQF